MNNEDLEILRRGELELKKASSYRHGKNRVGEVSNWTAITGAIKLLGKGKLRTLIRLTRNDLDNNSNVKVILYVWFIDHIKYLKEQLAEYNPLLLYGAIRKTEERQNIYDLFQEPSSNHRLLISNPTVGGVGISLDDQHGSWPRHTYIIPDYRIIVSTQAIGRTIRANTKSKPKIRFVFCKHFKGEQSIIESLARKTKIMQSSLAEGQKVKFPGDFDDDIEDDNVDLSCIDNIPILLTGDVLKLTSNRNIDFRTLIPQSHEQIPTKPKLTLLICEDTT